MRGILLRRKKIWLLGGALLALFLMFAGIMLVNKKNEANALSYSLGSQFSYSDTNLFGFYDGNGKLILNAFCASGNNTQPALGRTYEIETHYVNSGSNPDDKYVKYFKIMYYYMKNNGGDANKRNWNISAVHWALTGVNFGYEPNGTNANPVYQYSKSEWPSEVETGAVYYLNKDGTGTQSIAAIDWTEKPKTINLNIEKKWDDEENKHNLRPLTIEVSLLKDGVDTGEKITLDKTNGWKKTGIVVEAGHSYSVSEPTIINYTSDGASCSNTSNTEITCTLTNHLDKEFIDLPVKKVWLDDENVNLTRPDSVRVWLYSNDSKTNKYLDLTAPDWSGTFTDLEKGPVYTVKEETDDNGKLPTKQGSETSYYENTATNCSDGECTVYNLLQGYRSFPVTKIWNDHGKENERPEWVKIHIIGNDNSEKVVTLNSSYVASMNTWRSVIGVPTYNSQGVEIVYSVTEELPDGTAYVVDSITGNAYDGFNITNTLEETVSLTVAKRWLDNGNGGVSTRPESISFTILKDGAAYGSPVVLNGDDSFINTLTPEQRSQLTPEQADTYMNTWFRLIDDLPRYDENDNEIEWTVSEQTVSGYRGEKQCWRTPVSSRGGIVDSFMYQCEITNLRNDDVSISVKKTWGNGGEDISSVSFIIRQFYYQNDSPDSGVLPRSYGTLTVTAANNWEGSISGLPRYDGKGRELTYDLVENPIGPYVSEQVGDVVRDENGNYSFTFNNTKTENTNIFVKKCWVDGNNQGGTRPDSLHFVMTIKKFDTNDEEIVADRATSDIYLGPEDAVGNCWQRSITNLPLLDGDGNRYEYSVEEDKSWLEDTDYVTDDEACNPELSEWSCSFVNRLEGETSKTGTKTWLDDNNRKNTRPNPENFEIVLYRNSRGSRTEVDMVPTWVQNADGKTWTYTFSDLPMYDELGYQYSYSVLEKQATITLDNGDKYSQVSRGIDDFTNLLSGKIDYCGKKVWIDQDAPEGFRPEDIVVTLTRDDGTVYTATVSASSSDEALELCGESVSTEDEVWYFKFEDLDKYDSDGREYDYVLSENSDIEHYVTTIAQSTNTIINDYESKPIKLTVNKIWLNDTEDDRPKSIKVTLYQNGKEYETIVLDDEHGWTHTWDPLDGNYEWTITEDIQIENYGTEIRYEEDDDGNIVVNIYNTKTPDTRDKGISRYVFIMSGILLSGIFVSKKAFARN